MSEPTYSDEVSIVARVLGGTAWLIVSDDLAFADGVARALRLLGATVHMLAPDGRGIERLGETDAQVALMPPGPTSPALQRALDSHAGLRGAARVPITPQQAWPLGNASPDVDALMRLRERVLQVDRRVREHATRSRQQNLELSELGLPRLLRALAEVPARFVVQLSTATVDAHVALDHGQWIGASYRPRERGTVPLDGMPALQRALLLPTASCLVLPAARLSRPGPQQPLDAALGHALAELHGVHDANVTAERAPWSSTSQTLSAKGTAQTIGPPRNKAAGRARRARHTSVMLAAAVGGFALMALVTVVLEAGDPTVRGGRVSPQPAAEGAAGADALDGLHIEPLAPEPVASHRAPEPQAEPPAVEATEPETGAASQATPTPPTEPDARPAEPQQDEDDAEGTGDRRAGSWQRSRRLTKQADHSHDPAQARALYERALHDDPRNPHALVGLARLDEKEGRLDEALALMERATAVRSRRVTYRVLQGRMLLAAKQPRRALAAFEEALRLRPHSRPAMTGARRARSALSGH